MGKHGNEGLRALKKHSFQIKINDEDMEDLELTYNKKTKKSQGDDNREMLENPILLSHYVAQLCLFIITNNCML